MECEAGKQKGILPTEIYIMIIDWFGLSHIFWFDPVESSVPHVVTVMLYRIIFFMLVHYISLVYYMLKTHIIYLVYIFGLVVRWSG